MIPHDPPSVKGVSVVFSFSFQIFFQKPGFHPPSCGSEGVLRFLGQKFRLLSGFARYFLEEQSRKVLFVSHEPEKIAQI
jgi:hypothetical protein